MCPKVFMHGSNLYIIYDIFQKTITEMDLRNIGFQSNINDFYLFIVDIINTNENFMFNEETRILTLLKEIKNNDYGITYELYNIELNYFVRQDFKN